MLQLYCGGHPSSWPIDVLPVGSNPENTQVKLSLIEDENGDIILRGFAGTGRGYDNLVKIHRNGTLSLCSNVGERSGFKYKQGTTKVKLVKRGD